MFKPSKKGENTAVPKKCKHGPKARSILVTACWNELDFAVSIGYKIDRVFECYVYANEAPIFSKFFSLLSREKIMYSEPEGNDLQKYVNDINAKMNYSPEMCLTTQDIKPNQLMRQYCKQDLVMLFGKLSQQNMRTKPIVIKSQQELENVTLSAVEDVFGMEKACVLIAKNSSLHSRHNRKANSFLYAYVLAYSRIYMYKTMNQIVEKNGHIYQISNDALYFSCPSNIKLSDMVQIGSAFGEFRNEYGDQRILSFFSFGTKCCSIKLIDSNGQITQIVKARGFSLRNIYGERLMQNFDFHSALLAALENQKIILKIPQQFSRANFVYISVVLYFSVVNR